MKWLNVKPNALYNRTAGWWVVQNSQGRTCKSLPYSITHQNKDTRVTPPVKIISQVVSNKPPMKYFLLLAIQVHISFTQCKSKLNRPIKVAANNHPKRDKNEYSVLVLGIRSSHFGSKALLISLLKWQKLLRIFFFLRLDWRTARGTKWMFHEVEKESQGSLATSSPWNRKKSWPRKIFLS